MEKGNNQEVKSGIEATRAVGYENCSLFEDCTAPICPLQPDSLPFVTWYPDEEVCNKRGFGMLRWLKIQKRIRKLHLNAARGFFTVKMLSAIRNVTKKMRGINPDAWSGSEDTWSGRRLKSQKGGQWESFINQGNFN